MTDTSHLTALHARLTNESARLAKATKPAEIKMRSVWVAKCRDEITAELAFLAVRGVIVDGAAADAVDNTMTDDELLAALEG